MNFFILLFCFILVVGLFISPCIIFGSNNKSEITTWEIIFLILVFIFSLIVVDKNAEQWMSENQQIIPPLVGFGPTIVFIVFFYFWNRFRFKEIDDNIKEENERIERKSKRIQELKEKYEQALNSGNKREAIIAGRKYYSWLDIYDEQRIQNDLLCFLNKE